MTYWLLNILPNIPDFLERYLPDPTQRVVAYGLMYSIIGLVQSYLVKTRLHVKSPKNIINIGMFALVGLAILRQNGIPDIALYLVIAGYVATEILGHRLFHITLATLYVIESEKQNVIVEHEVFYTKVGQLCVALQDNLNTLKRIFLGRHVGVEVNAVTQWKEDYTTELWICNKYEIVEETRATQEEAPEQGIRARISNFILGEKTIIMRLDVCDAHETSRWELIQKTVVLDLLVEKYEKTSLAYTKLRTLLTAFLVRKQSKVVLSALRTFEDAVTITEEERGEIAKVQQKLTEEKKGIDQKPTAKAPESTTKKEASKKVEYQ